MAEVNVRDEASNPPAFEEEISLREIIEVIWNGKWIIALTTIVFMALSGIYSVFIADPVYEIKSKVLINKINTIDTSLNDYVNEMVSTQIFSQYLHSSEVLASLIKNQELENWNIDRLQNNVKAEFEKKESVITLSMKSSNPEQAVKIVNNLVAETKSYVSQKIDAQLQNLTNQYSEQMTAQQQKLNAAIKEYNRLRAGAGLPTLILFQHAASGSNYMLQANKELLEELRGLEKEKQVEYEKINNKINKLTSLYNSYYLKYEEASTLSSSNIVDNKVTIISEAVVPANPVSPKILLNVAIAIVVGGMASVMYVFARHFWKSS